jgi:H+/Cl- antiporter ClcA
MIGWLNGVNYPGFLSVKTFITKAVGVVFSVSSNLCVGKEGPLAHIGANVAVMTAYLPGFELLRNNETLR